MTISREEAKANFRNQQMLKRAKADWNYKMQQKVARINAKRIAERSRIMAEREAK